MILNEMPDDFFSYCPGRAGNENEGRGHLGIALSWIWQPVAAQIRLITLAAGDIPPSTSIVVPLM
jgi:hypothetical protein